MRYVIEIVGYRDGRRYTAMKPVCVTASGQREAVKKAAETWAYEGSISLEDDMDFERLEVEIKRP